MAAKNHYTIEPRNFRHFFIDDQNSVGELVIYGRKACRNKMDEYRIKTVGLTIRNFDDAGVIDFIVEYIQKNKHIVFLELYEYDEQEERIIQVINTLHTNKQITNVYFGKELSVPVVKVFADVLKTNTTIKEIGLHRCNIGDEHMSILSDALTVNKTIVQVNLNKNVFTEVGYEHLGNVFRVNKHIQHLKLNFGKTFSGIEQLFLALKTNSSLISIELCYISTPQIMVLSDVLKNHRTLKYVSLTSVDFSDISVVEEFLNNLRSTPGSGLKYLDLGRSSKINFAGKNMLLEAVRQKTIVFLSMLSTDCGGTDLDDKCDTCKEIFDIYRKRCNASKKHPIHYFDRK